MVTAVLVGLGFFLARVKSSLTAGKFPRFRKQLLHVTVAAITLEFVPKY